MEKVIPKQHQNIGEEILSDTWHVICVMETAGGHVALTPLYDKFVCKVFNEREAR